MMRLFQLCCTATGRPSAFRYACSFTFFGVTVWTHESDRLPYTFGEMFEGDDSGAWEEEEIIEQWSGESTWTSLSEDGQMGQ